MNVRQNIGDMGPVVQNLTELLPNVTFKFLS